MPLTALESRRLEAGSTGWTADALNDPQISRLWETGHFELIEGVVAKMPAAYLEGSIPLRRLVRQLEKHLERLPDASSAELQGGEFAFELDLVLSQSRVVRADAALVTPEQLARQAELQAARGIGPQYGRLQVAPTLVIESVSQGHEPHDRELKRGWYAEFGIPHFWLLDPFEKTLDCLVLTEQVYSSDVSGNRNQTLRPSLFPQLSIDLSTLWL